MRLRAALRSTTMLSGLVGAVFFATLTAHAADVYTKAPAALTKPAVDGVNGKVEALGGSYAKKGLYGVAGSVAVPLQGQFGAQVDGAVGSFDSHAIGVVAGHFFWRNPAQGLLGVYADHTMWDQYGGVHVTRFGGEGEGYWGRWTLHGVAGVEFGNNSSIGTSTTSSTIAAPVVTSTTTTGADLANVTRFFDRVSLSYYLTDDWKASVGHRYMGGKNSLALGTEYAMAVGRGTAASLFAEGQIGEGSNNYGIMGGVRFYFGQHDKSLLRRQREDDPTLDWNPDSLFSITNSLGTTGTSTTHSCNNGEQYINGTCTTPP